MSGIHGVWKHEMVYGGASMVTVQTIREDGSYETHMVFPMGGGCRQHIFHYGHVEIGDTTLKLRFESGTTTMKGCEDASKNFESRGFTEAEINEAQTLLAQEIPYTVDGDTLTTTVQGPGGQMKIDYTRQRG